MGKLLKLSHWVPLTWWPIREYLSATLRQEDQNGLERSSKYEPYGRGFNCPLTFLSNLCRAAEKITWCKYDNWTEMGASSSSIFLRGSLHQLLLLVLSWQQRGRSFSVPSIIVRYSLLRCYDGHELVLCRRKSQDSSWKNGHSTFNLEAQSRNTHRRARRKCSSAPLRSPLSIRAHTALYAKLKLIFADTFMESMTPWASRDRPPET